MSEQDDHIPLGDGLHIDMGGAVFSTYGLSDNSEFAASCAATCDPEEMASYLGSQAAANLCMNMAMSGSNTSHEAVTEIEVHCKGPKRRLLGGQKCGAKIVVRTLMKEMPSDPSEDPAEGASS